MVKCFEMELELVVGELATDELLLDAGR